MRDDLVRQDHDEKHVDKGQDCHAPHIETGACLRYHLVAKLVDQRLCLIVDGLILVIQAANELSVPTRVGVGEPHEQNSHGRRLVGRLDRAPRRSSLVAAQRQLEH